MSKHLRIDPWLTDVELLAWTQEATSRAEYQRRLTIWLAYLEGWPAHRVARVLGVSVAAVWKWVSQYNRQGPNALERVGRGGRRWAFLTPEQERGLLAEVLQEAGRGQVLTAQQLLPRMRQVTERQVSLDYVYRLLHRHGWRKLAPRPAHVKADPVAQEAFKKSPANRGGSVERGTPRHAPTLALPGRGTFRSNQRSATLLDASAPTSGGQAAGGA